MGVGIAEIVRLQSTDRLGKNQLIHYPDGDPRQAWGAGHTPARHVTGNVIPISSIPLAHMGQAHGYATGIKQDGSMEEIGADPVPPNGGVAFHDTAVWMRAA